MSEKFERFVMDWSIQHITSSPCFPHGDAHAEKECTLQNNCMKNETTNPYNLRSQNKQVPQIRWPEYPVTEANPEEFALPQNL